MGIKVSRKDIQDCCTCFQMDAKKSQYLRLLQEHTVEPFFYTKSGKEINSTIILVNGKALTWGEGRFGKEIPDDILEKYEKKATKLYKSYNRTSDTIKKLYDKMLTEACYALSYRSIQSHKIPRK